MTGRISISRKVSRPIRNEAIYEIETLPNESGENALLAPMLLTGYLVYIGSDTFLPKIYATIEEAGAALDAHIAAIDSQMPQAIG